MAEFNANNASEHVHEQGCLGRTDVTAENNYDLAEFNANNASALDTLLSEHGVELVEFSDDVFKGMGEAARDVLATVGNTDATTKKVYDSFMAFRKAVIGWSKLSDQTYMNKRELVDFYS